MPLQGSRSKPPTMLVPFIRHLHFLPVAQVRLATLRCATLCAVHCALLPAMPSSGPACLQCCTSHAHGHLVLLAVPMPPVQTLRPCLLHVRRRRAVPSSTCQTRTCATTTRLGLLQYVTADRCVPVAFDAALRPPCGLAEVCIAPFAAILNFLFRNLLLSNRTQFTMWSWAS